MVVSEGNEHAPPEGTGAAAQRERRGSSRDLNKFRPRMASFYESEEASGLEREEGKGQGENTVEPEPEQQLAAAEDQQTGAEG